MFPQGSPVMLYGTVMKDSTEAVVFLRALNFVIAAGLCSLLSSREKKCIFVLGKVFPNRER